MTSFAGGMKMKRITSVVGFCAIAVLGGVGYGQTVSVEKRRADGALVSSNT